MHINKANAITLSGSIHLLAYFYDVLTSQDCHSFVHIRRTLIEMTNRVVKLPPRRHEPPPQLMDDTTVEHIFRGHLNNELK